MRTTLDIDSSVLDELRRRQREEDGTLGGLASQLLARALHDEGRSAPAPLRWVSGDMAAQVDLDDHDAVERALDEAR